MVPGGNLKIGFMAWLVVWNHPYIGMVDGKYMEIPGGW
jgi:hypothetical protein